MKEKTVKKVSYIFKILFAFFIIACAYVFIYFVKIFNKNNVTIYEVNSGEIVNVDRHKGIIYRDEHVITCKNSGYINFYVTNAKRVGRGAFIYSINDEKKTYEYYDLTSDDKNKIQQNIKMYTNSISDYNFSDVYLAKNNIDNLIEEINIIKQLENIDIENELNAKEKGYSRYAGLISFNIDNHEGEKYSSFSSDNIKKYDIEKVPIQKEKVDSDSKIYKVITNPEFVIAFDSDYDYDNYTKNSNVFVKFVYENVTTRTKVSSFIGDDGKKHFKLDILEFPERFIDKRVVEFEIENKKISGLKIPIKSIASKNCYKIPKNMFERDAKTNENILYKLNPDNEKVRITCDISKEDNENYYISIDDSLSGFKYGDVLTNRYNDLYSLSEVVKLDGVYNMNKGYAVFKNIEIIDKTNEYAIIKNRIPNGVSLYDHIALDARKINEWDYIS